LFNGGALDKLSTFWGWGCFGQLSLVPRAGFDGGGRAVGNRERERERERERAVVLTENLAKSSMETGTGNLGSIKCSKLSIFATRQK
jgi:hypothetical protein